MKKLIFCLFANLTLVQAAGAATGYNGQCPQLAGNYVNDADHSPMVISQTAQADGSIIYGYGSYGADENMLADGKAHTDADGAIITVSCVQGILVKAYSAEGIQGQMTFRRRQDGGVVLQNKGVVNSLESYSLSR